MTPLPEDLEAPEEGHGTPTDVAQVLVQLESPLSIAREHPPGALPNTPEAFAGVAFEGISYPGTQHAFFNDDRPEIFNKEAADDTWRRSLAFFRANL